MAQANPWEMDWSQPQGGNAPAGGPVYGAPAKPDTPPAPKTTYRDLSPEEVAQRGLPAGVYQISSEGNLSKVSDANKAEDPRVKQDTISKLRRTIDNIDKVAMDALDNGGWGETGMTGAIMSGVPGSASYDLRGDIKTIDANSAFDALSAMRNASPTGGALGSITEKELDLLKSSVANLDPNKSSGAFIGSLAEAKRAYLDMLGKLDPNAVAEYKSKPGIRFDPQGGAAVYFTQGEDSRQKRDPFGLLNDQTPPDNGGGGGGFMSQLGEGAMQGIGDIAQGLGNLGGLIGNPLNATINAATGSNLSTDLGQSLRDGLGLPKNDSPTASMINQAAAGGFGMSAAARGLGTAIGTVAGSAPVRNALLELGRTPIADTVSSGVAGGASETARQNNMGALGQVGAALVGGTGGYMAARSIGNRLMSERAPNALMQAADSLNVQMLPADVGGVGTRMATGGIGRTLGGIPIAEGAQKSIDSAAAARNNIAASVGDVTDNVGAGQAIKRGFDKFTASSKDRADKLYSAISVPADSNVQLSNTRTALSEVTQGLRSNPQLSKLWAGHPRLKATLEALTPTDTSGAGQVQFRMASQKLTAAQDAYDQLRNQVVAPERLAQARKAIEDARSELDNAMITANRPTEGGQLSWADMNRFRSIVGEIIGQPGVTRDGSDIAALRKLYGALTTDMEATAAQQGPRALTEFRRATQFWRGREARIDDVFATLLGKDGNRSDEAVFKQINQWAQNSGGDFGRVARTIRSMPEDEANTVRATIVQRMGLAPARRQDVTQEVFSPAEFAAQWNGMAPRAKSVIFPNQQHRQDLDKLAMLMDGMKQANQYQNFSNTSLGVNVTTQGAIAYANLPMAITLALGQFGAGKLLASPRFARAIASTVRLPEQVAPRKLSEQLKVVAAREPLIANDVRAVADYVSKTLSQSPVRAAASEEEQNRGRVPPQQ